MIRIKVRGIALLTPFLCVLFISQTTAQSLWSLQKHPQGKSALGLNLGLFNGITEVTGGIEHGVTETLKLTASGGFGFVDEQDYLPPGVVGKIDVPPIFVSKMELIRFKPLNKTGLNLFGVGNLQYGHADIIHTYILQGALGLMTRLQAEMGWAITPFARLSVGKIWVTGPDIASVREVGWDVHVGFEIEVPNASVMVSFAFTLDTRFHGIILGFNLH